MATFPILFVDTTSGSLSHQTMSLLLPSFRRQQRILDFAFLEHNCPEGIYIAISPDNPAAWSGVLFARAGPFESAVLRFDIIFPSSYPDTAPAVIFSTDVFHPLVVPLTQYTFSASTLESAGTVSASDEDRVPPGSFSLRHGFPQWSARGTSARSSLENKAELESATDDKDELPTGAESTVQDPLDSRKITLQILEHVKQAFEDAEFLDTLPFAVVGNPSAWHAWRAYRGLAKQQARGRSPGGEEVPGKAPSSPKQMSDWNWDGVWESRVHNGINSSISEAGLFTNQSLVRFAKLDKDQLDEIRQQIRAA